MRKQNLVEIVEPRRAEQFQDYTELKDSYILFICKHDPFKDENEHKFGLPCYTFRNICTENDAVNLNDKAVKVIYNASAYEKETDERIKNFLHFISTNEPGKDDFSNRLSALVSKIKENEKFRSEYAAMNLHDRDITRAAKKEGARQKALETARKLLAKQIPLETVLECTGLTEEDLKEAAATTN